MVTATVFCMYWPSGKYTEYFPFLLEFSPLSHQVVNIVAIVQMRKLRLGGPGSLLSIS